MLKTEILESYDWKEKNKVLKYVNEYFTMLDHQILEDLYEIDDYIDDEGDFLSSEHHKNTMKLEYINKGYLPEEFILEDSVFDLSRKIVNFTFRDGIVEDMHAGKYGYDEFSKIPENTPLEVISQLSDSDMKALNTYMMDRVGYILHLIQNAEYTKLHYILNQYEYTGDDWDHPNIEKIEKDTEEIILVENYLNKKDNKI